MADVKSLEHPTLKVPYEIFNKKFRSAQKTIDREVSHVQAAGNDIEKCLQKSDVTVGEVSKALDSMVEKLTLLKRKTDVKVSHDASRNSTNPILYDRAQRALSDKIECVEFLVASCEKLADESIQDELDAARMIKKRVDHLQESDKNSDNAKSLWQKKRLDRMLVEFFLRSGYYNTAVKLAKHTEIEDLTNIDLFLLSKEIEESLIRRETAPCLNWCYENKNKLKKMKSTLEFQLRQQEFIELVRNNRRIEAVRHARKYFVNLEDDQLSDVQKVMGLLAFPSNTEIQAYKELLDSSRWDDLVQQFRQENFKLHQLNNSSVFEVTLQAGLSALKTPQCYKKEYESRNPDCPVCSKHLNELAKPLPHSHCANSKLICHISMQALNEYNPPMMLPNGLVYGYNALQEMAASNDGTVVCPKTKEIYTIDQCEKVFVM